MSLKFLSDYPAYHDSYHFIGSTKYRLNMFLEEEKRLRLYALISEICENTDGLTLIAASVAYNHVHILVQSTLDVSFTAQRLFGISSRLMRKEFPDLMVQSHKALWGGKSCKAIIDEQHFSRCVSYIKRHQPDNTKLEEL